MPPFAAIIFVLSGSAKKKTANHQKSLISDFQNNIA